MQSIVEDLKARDVGDDDDAAAAALHTKLDADARDEEDGEEEEDEDVIPSFMRVGISGEETSGVGDLFCINTINNAYTTAL